MSTNLIVNALASASLALVGLSSCVTVGDQMTLGVSERAIACETLQRYAFGLSDNDLPTADLQKVGELANELDSWQTFKLPRNLKCEKAIPGYRREPPGNFVQRFALSPDNKFAAIDGGFIYLPMLGTYSTCFYENRAAIWTPIGCYSTGSV